jgi:chaperonin cofactor prefoldin
MNAMREAWTDERLDDLNLKVDGGFAAIDARFDRLEANLDRRFERIDQRFERVDEKFERVDEKFERIDAKFQAGYRLMIQIGSVVVAALLGMIATQI